MTPIAVCGGPLGGVIELERIMSGETVSPGSAQAVPARDGTLRGDPSTISIVVEGVRRTVREVAREHGVPLTTARWRVSRGWNPLRAATERPRGRASRGHLDGQSRPTGALRRRIGRAVFEAARRSLDAPDRAGAFAAALLARLPRRLSVDPVGLRTAVACDGRDVLFVALIPPLTRRVWAALRVPRDGAPLPHETDGERA